MNCNVKFSAAANVKIQGLKTQNFKVSEKVEQINCSRSGVCEILYLTAKKKFRSTNKNISTTSYKKFMSSLNPQSVRKITRTSSFPISRSSVRLKQANNFHKCFRIHQTSMLKLYYEKPGILWSEKYIYWTEIRLNVFFRDNKTQ